MDQIPDVDSLAALHAACFTMPRPWSATELAGLLSSALVFHVGTPRQSMALGRVVADEAELLTLAVAHEARGKGLGRATLDAYEREALERGAVVSFLEVAESNHIAIALYHGAGYAESGRRANYYTSQDGEKVAAVIMSKPLKQA